jgi:GAF domain-containing protein
MPPRTLASLAHALSVAPDLDAALVALGEGLAEVDRSALLSLVRYDARRDMLTDSASPVDATVQRATVDCSFDHIPIAIRHVITAGGQFADFGDKSEDYARMLGIRSFPESGLLSVRGIRFDGMLSAMIVVYEPKKMFGTRASERFSASVSLFDLGFARFAEHEAREDAVRALEELTQKLHAEYLRKLGEVERQLNQAKEQAARGAGADPARVLQLEREAEEAQEVARRAERRAEAVDHQVMAAVGQLEQAHIELHRRSEALRQKTRTLYLIERMLTLYATTDEPRALVDGLLLLVGDDMQAQRCSLMLVAPDPGFLFIAAAHGLGPDIPEGTRVKIGAGVAGRVAATREPLLVQDAVEAMEHELLHDPTYTSGSFISFPIIVRDELLGVMNLANRVRQGVFVEDDVERVRFLSLVLGAIVSDARLPERLGSPGSE